MPEVNLKIIIDLIIKNIKMGVQSCSFISFVSCCYSYKVGPHFFLENKKMKFRFRTFTLMNIKLDKNFKPSLIRKYSFSADVSF